MNSVEMVGFPIAAVLWLLGCWSLTNRHQFAAGKHQNSIAFLLTTLVSAIFCLLWHWPKLQIFTPSGFYPGDSIYTLGPLKATALACFTTALLLIAVYASWRATNVVIRRVKTTAPVSVASALLNGLLIILLYWVFLSLVPQLYYVIYLQIFPNLPSQFVVKGLIPGNTFLNRLLFLERQSMSSHASGLLGWVLFVNATIQWLRATRE